MALAKLKMQMQRPCRFVGNAVMLHYALKNGLCVRATLSSSLCLQDPEEPPYNHQGEGHCQADGGQKQSAGHTPRQAIAKITVCGTFSVCLPHDYIKAL